MSDFLLRFVKKAATALIRVNAPRLSSAQREELAEMVCAACSDARMRRGIFGMAVIAVAELLNIATMSFRQRLGVDTEITQAQSIQTVRLPGGFGMIIDDFRRVFRRLTSSAGALALTVAMLSLAIGVTAAMFTVLDALVLNPVPFKDADRLVRVVEGVHGGRGVINMTRPVVVQSWRAGGAFEQVEGAVESLEIIEGGDEPLQRYGARITLGTLKMLGVQPILGRDFVAGEGRTGTDDRLLLSEELWTFVFNRDPGVIGRRIRVSGASAEIIGVMPAGFRFPRSETTLWQPIDLDAPPTSAGAASVSAFARLARGVPRADALRLADQSLQRTAQPGEQRQTMLRPVAAGMVDVYSRQAVTALSIAVALVFFVLCANGMNLMLTRFTVRHREFAMCAALGAHRLRLLREALMEAAMIGAAAFVVGLALTKTLVSVSAYLLPESLLARTLTPVAVSWRAVAVTSVLGFVATAISGLAPAWMATKVDTAKALRVTLRTASSGGSARRLGRGLLVIEVALATVLVACAALLLRTYSNLSAADRGLSAEGVITGWITLPEFDFVGPNDRLAFAGALEERLRQFPGIQQVNLSNGVPPGTGFTFFGKLRAAPNTEITLAQLKVYSVGPEFFDLFRIPLRAGRTFSGPSAASEVIIGERLAAMLWAGGNAVGQSFYMGSGKVPNTVVGVVKEIRNPSADPRLDPPELYFPLLVEKDGRAEASALSRGQIFVALRCAAVCPPLPQIRDAIHAVGAKAVIASLGPLDDEYFRVFARPRAAATLGAAFGLIALVAATGGMFGVLAAGVAHRAREFGIRAALGMQPRELRGLVFRDASVLATSGLAIGALGAFALGRALSSVTFEVGPADPGSWGVVSVALAVSVIVAAWTPAAQAARADPIALLREE